MELSEIMSPSAFIGALVTLGLAAIGFIVWLVRLEGKTNANSKAIDDLDKAYVKEIAQLKRDHESDIKDLKEEMKDTRERLFKHVADVSVHHNTEAVKEFRENLDRRLDTFDENFKDLARKLNHLGDRD